MVRFQVVSDFARAEQARLMDANLHSVIERVRDHYVAQFEAFVHGQRERCVRGQPEVKLGGLDSIYKGFYCADFVKNDSGVEIMEFLPDRYLTFPPVDGRLGPMRFRIVKLCWDDVVVDHGLVDLAPGFIEDWFEEWFDPDDTQLDPAAKWSSNIHSVSLQERSLSIDFGTAPANAFWSLLRTLSQAGARNLEISTSRI